MRITNNNLTSRLDAINSLAPGHTIHTQTGLVALVSGGGSSTILRAKTKAALYDQMGGYLLGIQLGNRLGEAAGLTMAAARA